MPTAEFAAVCAAASNRLRLALVPARDAGLRRSVIEKFKADNVDFDHNEVFGRTKNNARYRVPMTQRLRAMLAGIVACAGADECLIAAAGTNRRAVSPPARWAAMLSAWSSSCR